MVKFHLVYSCDETKPLEASIVSLAGVVGSARLESRPYNKFKLHKLWLGKLSFKNISTPVLFCINHIKSMIKCIDISTPKYVLVQ